MLIMTIEMMFNQTPARIISFISNWPELKTITLGAVAKGSIKAQELATQTEAINAKGCTSRAGANEANTGIIKVQVAIF